MASILVVDDESSMRDMLEILLRKQGHEVHLAADAPAAVARAAQGELDLVVTDLRLGSGSGMDVLAAVKTHSPATEVVVITAFATAENAIQAMKLGAYDYVLKPFKLDELKLVVAKALERRGLVAENRALRHRAGATGAEPELIGRSPGIEEVRSLVEKVARARSTILVTGESGTGKEVVARALHRGAGRDRPVRGRSTAAPSPRRSSRASSSATRRALHRREPTRRRASSRWPAAARSSSTRWASCRRTVQVKLLRVLQERRIRRVGGQRDIAVDARDRRRDEPRPRRRGAARAASARTSSTG